MGGVIWCRPRDGGVCREGPHRGGAGPSARVPPARADCRRWRSSWSVEGAADRYRLATPWQVLALQRSAGNQAVASAIATSVARRASAAHIEPLPEPTIAQDPDRVGGAMVEGSMTAVGPADGTGDSAGSGTGQTFGTPGSAKTEDGPTESMSMDQAPGQLASTPVIGPTPGAGPRVSLRAAVSGAGGAGAGLLQVAGGIRLGSPWVGGTRPETNGRLPGGGSSGVVDGGPTGQASGDQESGAAGEAGGEVSNGLAGGGSGGALVTAKADLGEISEYRAPVSPVLGGGYPVLAVQRSAGNRAIASLLQRSTADCGVGCGCEACSAAPAEPLDRRQGGEPVVQREGGKPVDVDAAIKARDVDALGGVPTGRLGHLTVDQRLAMIDILLGNHDEQVRHLWDSFGKSIMSVANGHADLWQRSFQVARDQMRLAVEVTSKEMVFYQDVEDVTRGYLDQNETFCKQELERLGLGEHGEVLIGPPTADQAAALAGIQADAQKLAADQEALADFRKVVVGYHQPYTSEPEFPGTSPVGGTGTHFDPIWFDPSGPQEVAVPPRPGEGRPWPEVKKAYDDLDHLIRVRLMTNPTLFPLARDNHEDPTKTKTVATGSREEALATIGRELYGVITNIGTTRPLLHSLTDHLEPVIQQLLDGTVAKGDRNWHAPGFYQTLGDDIREQRKPGPWWESFGLATLQVAAFVFVSFITGGLGGAVAGAAYSAAQVALAEGKAQALEAADKSTVREDMALVTKGQVDEAKAEVIENAAFAVLDTVGALRELRVTLKEIREFEAVAAAAQAQARKAADEALAKEAAKEAEEATKQARTAADEAKAAADKAKVKADTATAEEASRAKIESDKARKAADDAGAAADEAEAILHEPEGTQHPSQTVGDHAVTVRGIELARCSVAPCAGLATAVRERVADLRARLEAMKSKMGPARVAELEDRLTTAQARADRLCEEARRELSGSKAKAQSLEARYVVEGATVESEMQSLERNISVEAGLAQGSAALGRQWGEFTFDTIKHRIDDITAQATAGAAGPLDRQLARDLEAVRRDGTELRDAAIELEKPPHLRRPVAGRVWAEGDLTKRWQDIDTKLDSLEREQRARRELDWSGTSLGASDDAIRARFGVTGKAPDFAYAMGETLVLGEAKGVEIDSALAQFEAVSHSPELARYKNLDQRIYLSDARFQKLLDGEIPKFRVDARDDPAFLLDASGNRVFVNRAPVRIFRI